MTSPPNALLPTEEDDFVPTIPREDVIATLRGHAAVIPDLGDEGISRWLRVAADRLESDGKLLDRHGEVAMRALAKPGDHFAGVGNMIAKPDEGVVRRLQEALLMSEQGHDPGSMVLVDRAIMADNLLPCPFCGGEAQRHTIEEEGDNFNGDVICCTRCQASSHVEFGRKENLVSAWNTRALASSPTAADLDKDAAFLTEWADDIDRITGGHSVDAARLRKIAAAFNSSLDKDAEIARLREALRQINAYSAGGDLNEMECSNCHDKWFDHYFTLKGIARAALTKGQVDAG